MGVLSSLFHYYSKCKGSFFVHDLYTDSLSLSLSPSLSLYIYIYIFHINMNAKVISVFLNIRIIIKTFIS